RERQLAEQRLEKRGLPASVRADDRDPVAPADLEVDRAEPEGAALDDRRLEPRDHVAASPVRAELEVQLPRLERLLHPLQPFDPPDVGLAYVLRLLLLAALPVAALLPLLHPPQLRLDPLELADVDAVRVVVAAASGEPSGLVLAPPARILDRPARSLAEPDDPRHRSVGKAP